MAKFEARMGMGIEAEQIRPIQLPEKSVRTGRPPSNCSLKFRQGFPSDWKHYDCVLTQIEFSQDIPSVNDFVQFILTETDRQMPTIEQLTDDFFIDYSQLPTIIYIASPRGISQPAQFLEQDIMSSLLMAVYEHKKISLWIPTMGAFQNVNVNVNVNFEQCLETTVGALNSLARNLTEKSFSPVSIDLSFLPVLPNTDYESLISEYTVHLGKEGYFDRLEWLVYTESQFPKYHKLETQTHLTNDGRAREDLLGHKRLSSALAAFLRQRDEGSKGTSLPITIAIDGAWGTGKSSIMGFLADDLQGVERNEDPPVPNSWIQSFSIVLAIFNLMIVEFWLWFHSKYRSKELHTGRVEPRAFETVWINAWRHGTGERLKARMVHLIIKDLTRRYGWQFLFELNLSRFNKSKLLRVACQRLLSNFLMILIIAFAGWLLMLFAVDGYDPNDRATAFANGLPGGVLLLYSLSLLISRLKRAPEIAFNDYFSQPNYEELVGADMEVETDFERILEVLAKRGRTLALFIDDLDRCSPNQVAEVIESLNVFFGRDEHKCVFILGMHFDLVAATLDVANEKIGEKIDDTPELSAQRPFGRRFLEKIVQFTLTIPQATQEDTERYIGYLSSGKSASERLELVREALTFERELRKQDLSISDTATQWSKYRENFGVDREDVNELWGQIDDEIRLRERLDRAHKLSEQDPTTLLIFNSLRFALRRNPRQYKRFFNSLRFRNYIEQGMFLHSSSTYEDHLLAAAKTVVLELEYPPISKWLNDQGYNVSDFALICDDFKNADNKSRGKDAFGLLQAPNKSLGEKVAELIQSDPRVSDLANLSWRNIQRENKATL